MSCTVCIYKTHIIWFTHSSLELQLFLLLTFSLLMPSEIPISFHHVKSVTTKHKPQPVLL